LFQRILIAFCVTLFWVNAANAFVVEGPRQSTGDPVEDLRQAPRWAVTEGSLVQTGQRGLGGGLEYVIDDSICQLNLVDGGNCEGAKTAIRQALSRWSDGHPALAFSDVTGRIKTGFPLAVLGQTQQGAEIDFLASTPAEFPNFRTALTNGYTIFYTRGRRGVLMTNGVENEVAEGAIESADIRVNLARCYYLDPEFDRPDCVHFPTLIFHEIGHALGIGHPDDSQTRNLDNDDIPYNALPIDCMDPTRGLKSSMQVQAAAVLVGRDVQGAGRWRRGLTHDDAAARNALYPHCDIETPPRFTRLWGAFARDPAGVYGRSSQALVADDAVSMALADCAQSGGHDCQVISGFNGCFAYALARAPGTMQLDRSGAIWASATDERSIKARIDAVEACNAQHGECRVELDFCAFD
tara:strand:+ start:708 stop:1937 length:1230 start_codon:yes stop_codon:yes gene_type:complete